MPPRFTLRQTQDYAVHGPPFDKLKTARSTVLVLAAAGLLLSASAFADEPVDYQAQLKPLFARRCVACHGPLKQHNGLRLDTVAAMLSGGDSGPAIVPGKSSESLIVAALAGADGLVRMPPEGEATQFSADELALVSRWIDQGAVAPDDEKAAEDPRQHWSLVPAVRPAVPQLQNGRWANNVIDAFIAAEHERLGRQAVPPAAPHVWLRRVYLDLVGIPPTRAELADFVADSSRLARERVVDRLLASPRYGERWGRHWMDVWRYSDPFGSASEFRYSQRHVWRWREWIVESLNADKGYDSLVIEMLAGDEIAPGDPKIERATGFIARNWYKFNRNDWLRETVDHTAMGFLGLTLKCARCHDHKFDPVTQEEYYRFRAFFEPHDVRADSVPGQSDVLVDGVARVYDANTNAPTYVFIRGDDRYPDQAHPLSPGVPAALGGPPLDIQPVSLPPQAYYPALRAFAVEESLAAAESKIRAAEAEVAAASDGPSRALADKKLSVAKADSQSLIARTKAEQAKYLGGPTVSGPNAGDAANALANLALAAAQAQRQAALAQAELAVHETQSALAIAQAAVAAAPGDEAAKKALAEAEQKLVQVQEQLAQAQAVLNSQDSAYQPLGTMYPATSSGRRLALARWIASRENPRTARVAVNHIWLRHFGSPLVPLVANFGASGQPPTHPRLLDALAVELVEHGWSMKHLHRLIVTSRTYGLSSAYTADPADSDSAASDSAAIDPANHYLWRMNYRRMEAEIVRDSVLAVAGELDSTMGGPFLETGLGETSHRRSLYFEINTERKMPLLDLFDLASPNECYQRRESVVPQQALALANSALALAQARKLARRLSAQTGDASVSLPHAKGESEGVIGTRDSAGDSNDAFITAAFEQVLTRAPSSDELDRCRTFLTAQTSLLRDPAALRAFPGPIDPGVPAAAEPAQRARENLVHVLINHNDFVTVR